MPGDVAHTDGPRIIPAATVLWFASSMRMKLPVVRFAGTRRRTAGLRADRDAADLVERQLLRVFVAVQVVDLEAVVQRLHDRFHRAGGVLEHVAVAGPQGGLFGEPADGGVDVLTDLGLVVRAADHVAARHVDVVVQGDGDRHR